MCCRKSSSGIIEAPILKVPTINVGLRQNGREMANSIFNIGFENGKLSLSLKKILRQNRKTLIIKVHILKRIHSNNFKAY